MLLVHGAKTGFAHSSWFRRAPSYLLPHPGPLSDRGEDPKHTVTVGRRCKSASASWSVAVGAPVALPVLLVFRSAANSSCQKAPPTGPDWSVLRDVKPVPDMGTRFPHPASTAKPAPGRGGRLISLFEARLAVCFALDTYAPLCTIAAIA